MHDILFRGKRADTSEWLYWTVMGRLNKPYNGKLISGNVGYTHWAYECIFIEDKTIGQYTGLKDKNNKRIFVGDILLFEDGPDGDRMSWCQGEVRFDEGSFYVTNRICGDMSDFIYNGIFDGTIIGNIHDDLELT